MTEEVIKEEIIAIEEEQIEKPVEDEAPIKEAADADVIKVSASAKAKKKPAPRVLRKDPDVDLHKTDVTCPDCNKTLRRYCLERHKKSFCKVIKDKKKQEQKETIEKLQEKKEEKKQKERDPSPSQDIQELLKQMIKSKVDEKKTRYTNMMSKIYKS